MFAAAAATRCSGFSHSRRRSCHLISNPTRTLLGTRQVFRRLRRNAGHTTRHCTRITLLFCVLRPDGPAEVGPSASFRRNVCLSARLRRERNCGGISPQLMRRRRPTDRRRKEETSSYLAVVASWATDPPSSDPPSERASGVSKRSSLRDGAAS